MKSKFVSLLVICFLLMTSSNAFAKELTFNSPQSLQNYLSNQTKAGKKSIRFIYTYKNAKDFDYIQLFNKAISQQYYIKNNIHKVGYTLSYQEGRPNVATVALTITTYTTAKEEQTISNFVNKTIKSKIKKGMSTEQKIKTIHDYIVQYGHYDTKLTRYDAYDLVSKKSAVCQGYALLMQRFMDSLKIPSEIVTGTAWNSEGKGPHAWNLVQVNGKWYHIDLTWDDPYDGNSKYVSHRYYLKSDSLMKKSRSWNYKSFPKANSSY